MTDQTSCCVDDNLESVQELCRKADQQRITVIELVTIKQYSCMVNVITK